MCSYKNNNFSPVFRDPEFWSVQASNPREESDALPSEPVTIPSKLADGQIFVMRFMLLCLDATRCLPDAKLNQNPTRTVVNERISSELLKPPGKC